MSDQNNKEKTARLFSLAIELGKMAEQPELGLISWRLLFRDKIEELIRLWESN